jgi:lipoprotein-anchoring transpeptidase ErfK/SrfK
MAEDSTMTRVSGHGKAVVTGRLWRIAVLTAAGAIGAASQAEAALYYWSDSEPGFSRPAPAVSQRRQKPRRNAGKKSEAPEKETAKPQGPLIIAISIDQQKLRVYDANGFYAETPISTGMRGHPTPMGVFSVIQKHKLHHSNIYSNAPMPFMQRITWSGVAMHAGVLPGYPASHGCIRMPMAFAAKMWNWTKMGARVVVTPGEMTPAKFSHPLLAEQKLVPQPVAADELKDNLKDNLRADAPAAAKADKAADAGVTAKSAVSVANLELRSTVGHSDGARPVIGEPAVSAPLREQTHTADASSALPPTRASFTMSDATPSGGKSSPREGIAVQADSAPAVTSVASTSETKSDAATSEAEPAKSGETASSDDRPVEIKSFEAAVADIKPADTDTADKKQDEAQAPVQASGETLKTDAASESPKAEETTTEATKADIAKAPEKADDGVTATTDVRPAALDQKTPEVKKDQARLPDIEKPAVAAAPKRAGQIAVFISRKDGKLYVRQNFAPLFDVPVTIAPSDRPLGTHVFTAQVDKANSNLLHWSVVSLPAPSKYAERRDEDERASHRRRMAGGVVEMKPMPVPNSPAEALDRLTIPADAMARITEALTSGGSIVVSDQGIGAGETGEGTDFIVSLR